MTDSDLKFILALDIDEAQKELDLLEKQAGGAFDPMLAAGKKLAAEMRLARVEAQRAVVEGTAAQFRPQPPPVARVDPLAKRYQAEQEAKREADAYERYKDSQMGALDRFGKRLGTAGNFLGTVGAAATSASAGLSGGDLGNISGGIAGMFHPAGAALGAAVGGVAGIIEAPFALMAKHAQNAAKALSELEGPLGVVGVGMEENAQAMEYIPVIGKHLADAERASKQMAEQNLRFMGKLSPAFSEMLQAAKDDIEALSPDKEKAKETKQANEFYRDVLAISGTNPATMERQLHLKENETVYFTGQGSNEERQRYRQLEYLRAARAGKEEYKESSTFYNTTRKVDAETFKELFNKDFKSGAGLGASARPAHFSSFMDYERELQQKAFNQGVDPNERRFNELMTQLRNMGRNFLKTLDRPGVAVSEAMGAARDGWNAHDVWNFLARG